LKQVNPKNGSLQRNSQKIHRGEIFFFTKRNNFAKSISLIRTTEIPALELFDHAPASSFRGVKKTRIQLSSEKS